MPRFRDISLVFHRDASARSSTINAPTHSPRRRLAARRLPSSAIAPGLPAHICCPLFEGVAEARKGLAEHAPCSGCVYGTRLLGFNRSVFVGDSGALLQTIGEAAKTGSSDSRWNSNQDCAKTFVGTGMIHCSSSGGRLTSASVSLALSVNQFPGPGISTVPGQRSVSTSTAVGRLSITRGLF